MLYTLLLCDRYKGRLEVDSGLIFCLQSGELVDVPTARKELVDIFLTRNRLVRRSGKWAQTRISQRKDELEDSGLPKILDWGNYCNPCFAASKCMLNKWVCPQPLLQMRSKQGY